MLSNLPPGGGFYRGPEDVLQGCSNGHKWTTPMFFEMGGWFYCDEDKGPVCPVCGLDDILTDGQVLAAIAQLGKAVAR